MELGLAVDVAVKAAVLGLSLCRGYRPVAGRWDAGHALRVALTDAASLASQLPFEP